MTDERYAFVEDVKQRKNIARSPGKKGKSRYGCSLPVDYMTTKEKRAANSRWISITYDRPISFEKFLAYEDEHKKTYLQMLIETYNGTTGTIAKMFGCSEAKIKSFRQELNVKSIKFEPIDQSVWNDFLEKDEFLRKPMSWETFKTMDPYDQQEYLDFLQKEMGMSVTMISERLFQLNGNALRSYTKNHHLQIYSAQYGHGRIPPEVNKNFEDWLSDFETPEEPETEESLVQEMPCEEEPAIKKEVNEACAANPICSENKQESWDVPSLELNVTIKSMSQIIDFIQKLPNAQHGKITFTF